VSKILLRKFCSEDFLMDHAAKRYMDRQRIVRTQNMDAAQEFLHGKGFELDVARRDVSSIDVCINCAVLPGLSVGYLQNGVPAVTRSLAGLEDYQVMLPISDPMEARIGGQTVVCGPHRATVSSPRHDYRVKTRGLGARFRICITERAVREQLAALLGEAPARHPEFARAMDLTMGFGNQFARYVLAAANDFEHANSIGASPITTTSFEQFIICELLLHHPHNYSEALMRLDRAIASRDVKRAIDYMHANLDAPVTIADISLTAGVAGRTLFKHFRDVRGVSPMQYLRSLRFEKARQELLNADAGTSVTEIATRWGFGHLGRFAVEFRKRFGESPSETLRRRQGAR
jgi:AraC-like DNA-binding protein